MKISSVSKKSIPFKKSTNFSSFFSQKIRTVQNIHVFSIIFHKKFMPFKIFTYFPSFFRKKFVPFKDPRISLEYQVHWIVFSFIFDIFLHIIDCTCRSFGLQPLGLSNKLPVSSNLLIQALIMQCSGGSISYYTRSLSLTSFMACLVWSLAMKNEAARTLFSTL